MAETARIHWFDEVDSTNTQLLAARGSLPSGTVFAALFQRAGKGQRGNRWESRSGENLTFSYLFKPAALPAAAQFSLSQAAALGVAGYLAEKGVSTAIKWPNDILVGGRKICGMLLEHTLSADKLADSVIGIGINLNQRDFGSGAPNAVSLCAETGQNYDPQSELPLVVAQLEMYLALTASEAGRKTLAEAYLARLYRMGEWHTYLDRREADPLLPTTRAVEGVRFEGCIRGISPEGLLRMERRDGTLLEFAFKEIAYIL